MADFHFTPTHEIPYGYCQCGCGQTTKIATRTDNRKGWKKGQPFAFKYGHRIHTLAAATVRFWEKVDKSGGDDACWLWTAGRSTAGYGQFSWKRKYRQAHRVAWELTNGSIADGLFVCHHCDNPPCCNPSHLFLGTLQDNFDDMYRKGRHRAVYGEDHKNCKLSDAKASEILRRYAAGEASQRKLAREFGVSRAVIQLILNRKSWRHAE